MTRVSDNLEAVRGQLSTHLTKFHRPPNPRTSVPSLLLDRLAITDFTLCLVRYALDRIPELNQDRLLRDAYAHAEGTAAVVWERLGLYGNAAMWARKGIASVIARAMPAHPAPYTRALDNTDDITARKLSRVWRGVPSLRGEQTRFTSELAPFVFACTPKMPWSPEIV